MKYRLLTVLLCLVLTVTLLSGTAQASDADYTFDSGTLVVYTSAGITAWKDTVSPSDIVSIIVNSGVTQIPEGAFQELTALKTLTFGGETTIGNNAFSNSVNLESITFEDDADVSAGGCFFNVPALKSLTFKGESILANGAFYGSVNLETVTFGGKTSIGSGVFQYSNATPNTKLTELIFPEGSTFGSDIFSYCTALESITFEGDADVSAGGCFSNLSALKNLTFKGESILASSAFYGSVNLETITFGGKTSIGSGVFQYSNATPNTKLTELTFPEGSTFGSGIFSNCTALESITFEGESSLANSAFSGSVNLETITFGGKTSIGSGVFSYDAAPNTKLKELTFPEDSTFGASIFSYCTALESITFEGDADASAGGCFSNVPALKSLTFKGESILANGAFSGSVNLETVTFGGKTNIGSGVFQYSNANPNTKLKELTFPEGSTFGFGIFSDCTALESITFEGDADVSAGSCFSNLSALKSLTFKGDSNLSNSAFSGCVNLETITFEGESSLANSAFSGSVNLETVTFGGKTSIGSGAFWYSDTTPNTKLTELTFPEGSTLAGGGVGYCYALETITFLGDFSSSASGFCQELPALKTLVFSGTSTIPSGTFSNTVALETITFGGKTNIGSGVFQYSNATPNTKLTELIFPEGSTFGSGIFSNCTALESITFEGESILANGVFSGSVNLETITFEGESSLSSSAFYGSVNLETITFGGKTNIGSGVFQYSNATPNTKLTELIFPEGSTFGSGIFSNCTALESITFEGESILANGVFSGSVNLETITFGGKTNIGSGVFSYNTAPNTKLKELTFPEGSTFGSGIFSYCTALESITFEGDADVSVGGCFFNVPALKSLTFKGKSVLGSSSFYGCAALKSISFADAATLNSGALSSDSYTAERMDPIILPAGSSLSNGALQGLPISSVEFMDITPGTIGDNVFKDCPPDALIYVPCCSVEAYTTALNEGANPANPIPLDIEGKHSPSDWLYDETHHWKTCTSEGCTAKLEEGTHTGGAATCQTTKECTACHQAYGELGTCDFTAEVAEERYLVSEATCISKAVYKKSCTVCGAAGTETFEYGTVNANNHVGDTELKDAASASCTEPGYTGDIWCKDCNTKIVTGELIYTGHTYGEAYNSDDTNHWKECTVCHQAYGELGTCDFTAEVAEERYLVSEATCISKAVYKKSCTVCGAAGTETFEYGTVNANNHVGDTELKDAASASCTEPGYTGDIWCKDCNTKIVTGELIYTGHTYGEDYNSDDTNHWKECACGDKTEAAAHTYGDWVTTKKADVGVEGSKERTCSVCGCKQTEAIPATTTPASGDNTHLGLLVALLVISGCGMITMLFLVPQKKGKYQR